MTQQTQIPSTLINRTQQCQRQYREEIYQIAMESDKNPQ